MLGLLTLFAVAALLLIAAGTFATVYLMTHPPRLTYGVAVGRGLPPSPTDMGLAHTEHRLRLSTGTSANPDTTTAWLVAGRGAPSPDGTPAPVVVVTHAWGESRYASADRLDVLAPHASHVLLYDLRGHGDSTPSACDVGTTEVADLLLILEQLRSLLPATPRPAPLVLFGASMGVGICLVTAARSAGTATPIAGVIGDGGYRLGMEPIVGHFRRNRYPVLPFYYPVGIYLSLRYVSDREFDRARHASMLPCPLLMMHGTADTICPIESARHVASAAKQSFFVSFEGADHLEPIALDRKKYRAAVEAFLSAVARGTPPPTALNA